MGAQSCCNDPRAYNSRNEEYEDRSSTVFTDCDIDASRDLLIGDNNLYSITFLAKEQLKYELLNKVGLRRFLEVAKLISRLLPTYHPDVLLTKISSGNWKRAYVAVKRFIEHLISNYDPETRQITKRNAPMSIIFSEDRMSSSSQDEGFNWSRDVTSITSFSRVQSSSIQLTLSSMFSDSP